MARPHPVRTELADAHRLYGEWLRRERRCVEARDQLPTACGMLEAMGAEGFAERARRELQATGQTARRRASAADEELTAQEALIVRLRRTGSCSSITPNRSMRKMAVAGSGLL